MLWFTWQPQHYNRWSRLSHTRWDSIKHNKNPNHYTLPWNDCVWNIIFNHLVVTLKIFTYKRMINIFCKILIVLQEKYMTSSEYFDSLRPWPGMCNIRSMWSSATVTVGDRASKSMITVHWQPSRYLHNKIKWYF